MGQRHQIFVKIINPIKYLRNNKVKVKTKELVKEFGTKEYSILAYHNQWLYGRSALQNAISLLNFGSQFTHDEKTNDKGWNSYDNPLSPKGIENKFYTVDKLTEAIGFIMNFRPVKTPYLEAGIGGTFYIGKEDEGINFDFTRGDNNDGITIIDTVENKYCFMNIFTYEREGTELSHSASDLPSLLPVSASDYVKVYYGETKDTHNSYYTKDKTPKEVAKLLADTKKINKDCIKPFEKFKVLNLKEIGLMFPDMEMFKLIQKGREIKL